MQDTILVLENNIATRELLELRLLNELKNCNIVSYSHKEDAIKFLTKNLKSKNRHNIKVAIVDYDLLDITGVEFAVKYLQKIDSYNIVFSTWKEDSDIKEALKKRVIDKFISKLNFDFMQDIVSVVNTQLKC